MNRLLTILLLAAGTAYGQIDNPPTSADIADATATGRSLLTTASAAAGRGVLGGSSFGGSIFTGTSASARPTLIASILGFSVTNNLGFDASLTNFWTATNAATAATAIGLGATNNVTFNELTATGNVTLSGANNIMPGATNAASASSLMTRDLSDDRYTTYVWLTGSSDNQTITNGGFKFLGPSRINSFSLGYGASIPAGYTKFRVLLNFGWLTDPATNSSNFQVFVRFNNMGALSSNPFEAEHGSVAGTTGLYPTNSPTNGLVGTLTRLGVVNTTNSIYSFRSEYETIPAAWQSNALSNGFYHLLGVALRNNSGGSLTDGYNAGHAPVGIIEFRK